MNKQNIIRCFLAVVLIVAAGALKAQDVRVDSPQQTVPGAMFGISQEGNTAAVSSVSGDDLYHTPAVNVSNSLAGRLTGLTLLQGSGQPGADNADWLIRGIGSHGYTGYNTAKIFVDGFEVNASYLTAMSPSEIESISILKDGASLTIFGDRGANGVIWVQTKRGKAGRASFTANLRGGVQMPAKINKPLGSYDYAHLYNIAASNDAGAWSPRYSNDQLTAYRNGTGTDVDWYEETMKKNGYYAEGDLSFNGGNEYARYFVVLGYLNQHGLFNVKNDRDMTSNLTFSRYNIRANFDFNVGRVVEASVDLGGKIFDNKAPFSPVNHKGGNNYGNLGEYIPNMLQNLATYPNNVYDIYDNAEKTHWSGTSVYPENPVAALNATGYRLERRRILQGNFRVKEKLDMVTKGLYLEQTFSVYTYTASSQNRTANYQRWNNGKGEQTTDKDESIKAGGWGSDGMEDWKQGTVSIGYDRSWGRHSLNAAAGAHVSAFKGNGYFSFKYNYLNYRGRVHYDYDGRYAAEVSLSTFGNDAYAKDQRWSVYPAVSGAWILSNEGFMQGSRNVDLLKVRASFGMSGASDSHSTANLSLFNNSNGRFLYKEYYPTYDSNDPSKNFYTGASQAGRQAARILMFIPNIDAKSETAYKYNFGADMALLGNRLVVTGDIFFERRKDILTWNRSIPGYLGNNDEMLNTGEMTNKGFEVMAMWSDRRGDWSYSVNGMVSFNRNKIIENGETPTKYSYNAITGRPYGTIIGLEADGLYGVDDFVGGQLRSGLAKPAFGDVQPGDIRYRDLDGNGIIDDYDKTEIGKSQYPEWTYSLGLSVAWKGLDLNLLLQGYAGASVDLLEANRFQVVPFAGDNTIYRIADNSWAYYPAQGIDNRSGATYPRLTLDENPHNYRTSSFWVKNFGFMKVRNIELGYTFRVSGMNNFRVYLNAANPFTFSKLQKDYDIDPEAMGYSYPTLRTFSLGLNLSF